MRKFFILSAFTFMVAVPCAYADDFGDRFYGEAPTALGDYTASDMDIAMDGAAQDMQDIMPAAGEQLSDEDIPEEAEESAESVEDLTEE